MNSGLEAGPLAPTVDLPGSKSYANRYLILAARHGGVVRDVPKGDDVDHMVRALRMVGLVVDESGGALTFRNSFPLCEKAEGTLDLDVGEGGTTARFLAALLARGSRTYRLRLSGRLSERPWEELLAALRSGGAHASLEGTVVEIRGPVDVSRLPRHVSAARSSQFATALELAFSGDEYRFEPTGLASSRPYWELTLACVGEYARRRDVRVPKDWSGAAFPLCFAAAVGTEVFLPGLVPDRLQADGALYAWLSAKGAATLEDGGVRAWRLADRSPWDVDMKDCLDLVPALAFLVSHLEGQSWLRGLEGLRHKESDRFAAVLALLKDCGVEAGEHADSIWVQGPVSGLGKRCLAVPADHRLVMAAALFLRAHAGGEVSHAEAVAKSFPDYFSSMGFIR